jgi:hypothetical protein
MDGYSTLALRVCPLYCSPGEAAAAVGDKQNPRPPACINLKLTLSALLTVPLGVHCASCLVLLPSIPIGGVPFCTEFGLLSLHHKLQMGT